jgi:hypothetical protein
VKIAGKKINNWYLIGGGVGVAAVIFLYRRHSGSGAAGSSPASGTNPLTGLPYAQDNQVDPATGMSYLQEAQQYGSVAAAEQAAGSGQGYLAGGQAGGVTSGYPAFGQVTSTGTPGGTSWSSNAQWAQAVTAGLTNLGYSPTDIAAALGLYFQSQPLGSGADGVSYLSVVQAAIAEFGPPPVGTFPLTGAPSAPGGAPPPPPPPRKVTIPNLAGERVENATSALTSLGLRYTFGPRRPNTPYYVTASSPGRGAVVAAGTTVHLTIKPNHP